MTIIQLFTETQGIRGLFSPEVFSILDLIKMAHVWWMPSWAAKPWEVQVQTSADLLTCGFTDSIRSLTREDWTRLSFYDRAQVLFLIATAAIQVERGSTAYLQPHDTLARACRTICSVFSGSFFELIMHAGH